MNLIEAAKTGRPFKRPHWATCFEPNSGTGIISFTVSVPDALAEDWEVQEKIVPMTRSVFWKTVNEIFGVDMCQPMVPYSGSLPPPVAQVHMLAKRLGLEGP